MAGISASARRARALNSKAGKAGKAGKMVKTAKKTVSTAEKPARKRPTFGLRTNFSRFMIRCTKHAKDLERKYFLEQSKCTAVMRSALRSDTRMSPAAIQLAKRATETLLEEAGRETTLNLHLMKKRVARAGASRKAIHDTLLRHGVFGEDIIYEESVSYPGAAPCFVPHKGTITAEKLSERNETMMVVD